MRKIPHTGPRKKVLVGTAHMSKPAQIAFSKAVNAAVEEEIITMSRGTNQMPDLWYDLAWELESFMRESFGDTINQKMLKRDRIEKIESLCRTIGQGGTYFAIPKTTH